MVPSGDRGAAGSEAERLRFERCFRAHYADVLAFSLRRLPDRQAAEDAAAETFAVVWRRRELIPAAPLPWLYAIAVRTIANQRRGARRRAGLEQRLAHEAGAGSATRDPGEALQRRTAFADAFGRLSEDEREVLRLIAWDDLAPREAAAVLGCSYGAFRVRFHRAKRKLAKQMDASGHLPIERRGAAPDPAKEIG